MNARGRPNYFVLLGLDPNALWNDQVYQRALSQARARWTRDVSGLQSRPETGAAKRYLQLYRDRDIQATMDDPDRREQERAEAKKLRAVELVVGRNDLEERLSLMLRRGYLLAEEVTRLRVEFSDVLAEDTDLARRIDEAEVRMPQADGPEPGLSQSMEGQLRDWLAQVNSSSLYDVLRFADAKVTNSSPLSVLIAAAEALYRDAHQQKDKADPSVKARERLSGLAKTIFASEDERRRHDMSMKFAAVQRLIERFEKVLRIAGSVTAAQFEWFLEQARTYGADDLDLAKDRFLAYFGARGWPVEVPPAEAEAAVRRKIQCPRCAQLNEPEQRACITCGLVLREPCPNCGQTAPRYGGGCSCGFPIGQRDLVEDLIGQAREALDRHELAQAEVYLDRAARIWDLPPGKSDPITTRIQQARSDLAVGLKKIESSQAAIQLLLARRRYVAATAELRGAPDNLPGRAALLAQAETAVQDGMALYREARQPGTPRARQAELYTEALRICDDLEQARTELARIPLEPPSDVRARVSDPAAGVLVTWRASPDPDVSYVVVRRTGHVPPETHEDLPGQARLGTATGTTWRDSGAVQLAGTPLTYAVFAERSGTFSSARAAEPVVVIAESEVQIRTGDAEVLLTWQAPPGAAQVRVTRQEGGGSAAAVWTDERVAGQLVDTNVRTGVRYRYTVRTAYRDTEGRLHWSAGTHAEIIPVSRPAPPGRLQVMGSRPEYRFYQHKVQIRSPVPERGALRVVRQVGIGSLQEGDQGPEGEIRMDGKTVPGSPPVMPDYWIKEPPLCSYVPVLVIDGMAYVGAARRYALAAEVSDLQGEFVGGVLRVGWNWPEGCEEALVGYSSAPGLVDPTAADRQVRVSRLQGERAGGCDIPVAQDCADADVVVGAVVKQDGVDFVTSGARTHIDRPATQVWYEVRNSGRHRRELVLRAAGPVDLPTTMLRGRAGSLPLTRDDGELVASYEATRLTGRQAIPLPRPGQPALNYRLFTVSIAAAVELIPE
jgi:hypothetical protein